MAVGASMAVMCALFGVGAWCILYQRSSITFGVSCLVVSIDFGNYRNGKDMS